MIPDATSTLDPGPRTLDRTQDPGPRTQDPSARADARSLARLRWRCRRGMLENDLILTRFLDARGEAISETEEAALCRLLDFADNELWDLLSGRTEVEDASLRPLLRALRSA